MEIKILPLFGVPCSNFVHLTADVHMFAFMYCQIRRLLSFGGPMALFLYLSINFPHFLGTESLIVDSRLYLFLFLVSLFCFLSLNK